MSENTYEAIYKIAKTTDTNLVVIWTHNTQITGMLLDCDDSKCIKGIITLKDAIVKCYKESSDYHFSWLNIPSCHITGFTFKCCVLDE